MTEFMMAAFRDELEKIAFSFQKRAAIGDLGNMGASLLPRSKRLAAAAGKVVAPILSPATATSGSAVNSVRKAIPGLGANRGLQGAQLRANLGT